MIEKAALKSLSQNKRIHHRHYLEQVKETTKSNIYYKHSLFLENNYTAKKYKLIYTKKGHNITIDVITETINRMTSKKTNKNYKIWQDAEKGTSLQCNG